MKKSEKTAVRNKKISWVRIIIVVGSLATVSALLPTFRSCQIAEQSLQQSIKNPNKARLRELEPGALIPLAVSPREIYEEIRSRPPLQRPDTIKNYIGNRVDWLLEFSSAKEEKDGRVSVSLRTSYGSPPVFPVGVSGEVNLSDYPWLKITQEGDEVWVRGTIRAVDTLGLIELDAMELELKQ